MFVYAFSGVDIDGQTSNIIRANWDAKDPESGLDYCEWSIGKFMSI